MCNAFTTGFDIATSSGPLCEEPMLGACFLIENVELVKKPQLKIGDDGAEEDKTDSLVDTYGPFTG